MMTTIVKALRGQQRDYQWRYGSHFKGDANAVGNHFEWLALQNGGSITTEAIVADAMRHDSVLHRYFEQDVEVAAENWHKETARRLIGSLVVVTVIPPEKTEQAVHAVYPLTIDGVLSNGDDEEEDVEPGVIVRCFPHVGDSYYPFQTVITNGKLFDMYEKRLIKEFKNAAQRAANFKIFSEVLEAIHRLPDPSNA